MDNYEDTVDYYRHELVYGYPVDGPYDFAIYKDLSDDSFFYEIEELIEFKEEDGPKKFSQNIIKDLARWMIDHDYDVTYKLSYQDVFSSGIASMRKFDSIEQVYAAFKLLVVGYVRESVSIKTSEDSLKYNVTLGWHEKAKVWVAECKDPVFTLEHESLPTLAQRVEKIIYEMLEICAETKADASFLFGEI